MEGSWNTRKNSTNLTYSTAQNEILPLKKITSYALLEFKVQLKKLKMLNNDSIWHFVSNQLEILTSKKKKRFLEFNLNCVI